MENLSDLYDKTLTNPSLRAKYEAAVAETKRKAEQNEIDAVKELALMYWHIMHVVFQQNSDSDSEAQRKDCPKQLVQYSNMSKYWIEKGIALHDEFLLYFHSRLYEDLIRMLNDLGQSKFACDLCPQMIHAAKEAIEQDVGVINLSALYNLYGMTAAGYCDELLQQSGGADSAEFREYARRCITAFDSASFDSRSIGAHFMHHIYMRYFIQHGETYRVNEYFHLLMYLDQHSDQLPKLHQGKLYFDLAEAYACGWGVPENHNQCQKYAERSAALGNREALEILQRVEQSEAENPSDTPPNQILRLFFSFLLILIAILMVAIGALAPTNTTVLTICVIMVNLSAVVANGFHPANKDLRWAAWIAFGLSLLGLLLPVLNGSGIFHY